MFFLKKLIDCVHLNFQLTWVKLYVDLIDQILVQSDSWLDHQGRKPKTYYLSNGWIIRHQIFSIGTSCEDTWHNTLLTFCTNSAIITIQQSVKSAWFLLAVSGFVFHILCPSWCQPLAFGKKELIMLAYIFPVPQHLYCNPH
jgi:hypothetical protein